MQYKRLKALPLAVTALILAGCPSPKPSNNLPNGVLHQYIDIDATPNGTFYLVNYYSSGDVKVSTKSDQDYAVFGSERLKMEYNSRHTEAIYYHDESAESGQEIGIEFRRDNGSQLVSSLAFAGLPTFIAPVADQQIDHSVEDIFIQWDSQVNGDAELVLSGSCIQYTAIDVPMNTQFYTFPANTLEARQGETECEVTIALSEQSSHPVNDNFAGGELSLTTLSEQTVQISGLN